MFLHGYTGDTSDWRHQIDEFSGKHRVLVLDNRGHGRSEAPPHKNAYTVESMVEDTRLLIRKTGISRYHLVGHSIGGAVAQEIAIHEPQSLLSLTLQDTTDWFGDHEEPGGTPPYISPEEAKRAAGRVDRMPQAALAGAWMGLLTWKGSADRAHMIQVPTLIIHGSRDASRIIEGSRRLAASIPHAEVVVIEGAGHSPQSECPEQFNAALGRFLEKFGSSTGSW